MKLADSGLIAIIEILRKGLADGVDISQLLRELDLEVVDGKLTPVKLTTYQKSLVTSPFPVSG